MAFKLDTNDASRPHVAMWPAAPRAQAGERCERAHGCAPALSPRVDGVSVFRLSHVARHDTYGVDHAPEVVHAFLYYHDTIFLCVLFDTTGDPRLRSYQRRSYT